MAADRPSPSETEVCPACGEEPGSSLACLGCGRILIESEGADHFTRLGLDPLRPFDEGVGELRYLKLSRVLHPDFQTGADEAHRERALRNSALLNEAWAMLTDEQLRAEYLLEMHEPGALDRHKKLSPAFLLEAMEISEQVDDAHSDGCQTTLRRIAEQAHSAIQKRMRGVAGACSETIERMARDEHVPEVSRSTRLLNPHDWNTEQIAVLLHQARVYRRILKDTEARR